MTNQHTTPPALARLFDLSGSTAIVTGAAQGMGKATAILLAQAGANVVASARRLDAAEQTVEEIRAGGGQAVAALTELTDVAQMDATVALAQERFGGVDILVNCAGGSHPLTRYVDVGEDILREVMDRNFNGVYRLSQRVARAMIDQGRGGRIVNVASTAAFRSDFQSSVYNATKAAIVSLTQSMSLELARHGIHVNTVAPGPIRTPGADWAYSNPKIHDAIAKRVPLGRIGTPEDIAQAALFAVSPASGFMTGATIAIDGGYMWT